ncbi:unnamed protein product [Amoebophrya sp. A25]|nr:unnamed protein product [Amoebophrya sp. A25]|eukprot:GSA25T00007518001.1
MEETEIRNFLVASGVEDDSIDYVMGMLQEEMPKSLEEVADLVGSFLDDDEVRISKLWTIIGAHRNNSACGPGGAATSPSQTSPADKDSALPTADAALLNSMSATEMRVLAGKSLGELLNDKNCSGDGTTEKGNESTHLVEISDDYRRRMRKKMRPKPVPSGVSNAEAKHFRSAWVSRYFLKLWYQQRITDEMDKHEFVDA